MTTETMREAVARAMDEALRSIDSDARLSELTDDEVRALTDAAIRTVLEMLINSKLSVRIEFERADDRRGPAPALDNIWQAMLDAAAREVIRDPAPSGPST